MKVAFIGAGKMAEAMISAAIRKRFIRASQIFASDVSRERRNLLKKRYHINTYKSNSRMPDLADVIVLAVKPQDLDAVLDEISDTVGSDHLVVSIAAGKRIESIEAALPEARVVRVMPNLACVVGESMSVYATGTRIRASDRKTTERFLGNFGKVLHLSEDHFDAVTALSGSGPAFFAYFLNLMVEAAVNEGLDRETALLLAQQTMLGTASVLMDQGQDPKAFIDAVSSPKGTTAEGIKVLQRSGIARTVERMIHAATRRSRELSR